VNNSVTVRNRHKGRPIDTRLLRKIALALMGQLIQSRSFELGIYILKTAEMTRLNETFLRHRGSTDVLAFDYSQPEPEPALCGEILVCLDEAVAQARRFRTTWQSELIRYIVHGALHLTGYDDHHRARRRKMKLQENRLLKQLGRQFDFSKLADKRR
jgi:probable rRNA maturation factor